VCTKEGKAGLVLDIRDLVWQLAEMQTQHEACTLGRAPGPRSLSSDVRYDKEAGRRGSFRSIFVVNRSDVVRVQVSVGGQSH
jgi:hypothetical protein